VEFLLGFCTAAIALACGQHAYPEKKLRCQLGVLLETPRAVLRAAEIASLEDIDFVVVGADELTQCVLGMSRDDKGKFMAEYLSRDPQIMAKDPFIGLDVGAMVEYAVTQCKTVDRFMQVQVTGHHCSDRGSVRFLDRIGVESLSCLPNNVPAARLAAAQAHIENSQEGSFRTVLENTLGYLLNSAEIKL
jgi:pyruvate,orthophosphate dikinase